MMKPTREPQCDGVIVSVCVCAYNSGKYLEECLDSILSQETEFKFEILINDDCSSDNTIGIMQSYASKYPDIVKVFYQDQNYGMKYIPVGPTFLWPQTSGKYVAFCDADDFWTDPLKLAHQIDFLEKNSNTSLVHSNYKILQTGKVTNRILKNAHGISFQTAPIGDCKETCFFSFGVAISSAVVRKEVLDKYITSGILELHVGVDYSLFVFAANMGQIGYTDKELVTYRRHGKSEMHNPERVAQRIVRRKKMLNFLCEFFDVSADVKRQSLQQQNHRIRKNLITSKENIISSFRSELTSQDLIVINLGRYTQYGLLVRVWEKVKNFIKVQVFSDTYQR